MDVHIPSYDPSSSDAAVPVRPDEIPNDLICAICFSLPTEPVVTPCEHLFCRKCLQQALFRQRLCPVDRTEISADQVRHLQDGSLLCRIWGGIPVKCSHHETGCAWTGPISDYKAHVEGCTHTRGHRKQRRTIEELREEIRQLRDSDAEQGEEIERLCATIRRVEAERDARVDRTRFNEVKEGIATLSEKMKELLEENKQLRRRPDLDALFTGNYDFGRGNVVKLSRLIARYLESKPSSIDSNRIYSCVENCYRDLKQAWNDNPEHYYTDVRMLLATCMASSWFTNNQNNHIRNWMNEQDWIGTR
jgi:hypothetical protein